VNDLYSWCGIYPFGFPQANIPAEAGNAMRINTPQVGADQHFGCQGCLFFITSYVLKYPGGKIEKLLVRVYFF
jgi:hypothetical protein